MIHRPVFQKVACFLAIITLAMSLLVFCPSCTLAEALPTDIPAEEEPADLALARLNRYAEQVMEQKNLSFGYPGNAMKQRDGLVSPGNCWKTRFVSSACRIRPGSLRSRSFFLFGEFLIGRVTAFSGTDFETL